MKVGSALMSWLGTTALVAASLAPTVLGPATASAAGPVKSTTCKPVITHVGVFKAGLSPNVTISGTCFGKGGGTLGSDSMHFRVSDLGPHGSLSGIKTATMSAYNWWNACSSRPDAVDDGGANGVKCTVSKWTNTSVTLASFTTDYGGSYLVKGGDKIAVQIWNVQTLAGPAWALVTAIGTGPASKAGGCGPDVTHVSVFHAGLDPDVTITGTCFGTGGAFAGADSMHFRVSDVGPQGTVSEIERASTEPTHNWWNACSSRLDAVDGAAANGVKCTVTKWTNTNITLASFTTSYGGAYLVKKGDRLVIQIWEAQTLSGPTYLLDTAR